MKYQLLNTINTPEDVKKIPIDALPLLASELRHFIIEVVSAKKGHLGAGLGVVELSIALHFVYNTPFDLLVWDVGHQAYPHKILCERKNVFNTLRQKNGIAGFPKRSESVYDAFGTGHSSTSISALLGMALASKLNRENHRKHIAVIGDASIASGMAFEALNHTGVSQADVLIILNDNEMGIDPHVGALKNYLTHIKKHPKAENHNLFEALNFQYFGPIDGHNIPLLIKTLEELKSIEGPKFLHVITTKGKGLPQAEKDQITYHAPGLFDKLTGEILQEFNPNLPPKYQDVFGLTLVELAKLNDKIIGITPAMPTGSSLKFMLESFPNRAFDVGIAEQHAVTFAAGFATQGFKPYLVIYSTFLQRAYDQLIHDVALQQLPVVFCIDRAGIVGADGATHHGVFDIAFMRAIPHLIVAVPSDEIMLRNLLYTAQFVEQPIAIRYPRGRGYFKEWQSEFKTIPIGKSQKLKDGKTMAILTLGHFTKTIERILNKHPHWNIAHYDMIFVKPLDKETLISVLNEYSKIITLEDGVIAGGFGSAVMEFAQQNGFYANQIICLGIPDQFVEHGSTADLLSDLGLDEQGIERTISQLVN